MNVNLTWKRQARDQDHQDRLRYNHQPWDHDDGQEFVTSSRSFIRNLPENISITSQAVFHLASSSAFCPLSISKILPRAASMLAFSPETFVEATEWTSGDDNYDRVSRQLRLSSLFSSWSPGWSNPPPPQMATATWEGEIFLRTAVPLKTIASLIANSADPLKERKKTLEI